MSDRISEILEVLRIVRGSYRQGMSDGVLRNLRMDAVDSVAHSRGIDSTTVSDKFRRQLKPDISGTREFDVALQGWLRSGDGRLKAALVKHSVSVDDQRAVRYFFDS